MKLIKFIFISFCILANSISMADESGERIFYGGVGSAKTGSSTQNGSAPFSLGFLSVPKSNDSVWGLDFAGEGTMLDSTYGQNKVPAQAISFNFLLGKNFTKSESSRFDGAVILGGRQTVQECPASYNGWQCYADRAPNTSYGFNFGVLIAFTYNGITLGARATGQSSQAIIGWRF